MKTLPHAKIIIFKKKKREIFQKQIYKIYF